MTRAHKRPFSIKDSVSAKTADSFTVSADGKVAFVVSEPSEDLSKVVTRIWMLDEAAPEGARPITSVEHKAAQPRFSRDGRLAYLTEVKNGTMQVAVLSGLGEPRVITKFANGIDTLEWSPDARTLLIVAAPDPSPQRKKAIENKYDATDVDADAPKSHMWLVSATGGKPRPIGPRDAHIVRIAWSPEGKRVAFLQSPSSHLDSILALTQLRLMASNGRGVRTLLRMHGLDCCGVPGATPRFSPDGSHLAVNCTGDDRHMGPDTVWTVRCSDGRAAELDRESDERAVLPRWLDNRTVVYFQTRSVHRVLRRAYMDGARPDMLVDMPGFVNDCEVSPDGKQVFFSYFEHAQPLEVYSADVSGRKPRKLTRLNARFDRIRHASMEVVRWKSREGWDLEGLFYRPTSGRPPYATVVIPHGGPHGQVNNAHDYTSQTYAANGYAVFLPNFRGSTGRGTAFYRSIIGDWGQGPADDIMRGVRMLTRKGLADGKRLVIHGGSYGGYMTAWLISHTRAFRAAVAHAPVINGLSMWGTTDLPSFIAWDFRAHPQDMHEAFRRQSPSTYLRRAKTPTLVTVGDRDVRVPPGQAQELYRALKAAGVPTSLVVYPREGHGIGELRHRLDHMRRCLAWFARHLGKDAPK
jgi:dipeptidyl aminopeptidase/acylaminoacyl peptidase